MPNEEIKRSYYAIIPANVRYDDELTPNAKLLYGEISALCNEKGYCWAENEYFSKLYGVSKTSISKWISSLIKRGYISSEYSYKEGKKEIEFRYLRIIQYPIEEKLNTPIEEKLKDNITDIINNILPKEDDNKPTCEFTDEEMQHNFKIIYDEYPRKEGKTKAYAAYRQWINGKKVTGIGIVKLTNEEMLEAVTKYAKDCLDNKRETKYIKHASTFFNNILDFVG